MPAKFTGGNTGTRTVQKGRSVTEPTARNHAGLEHSNTMTGMPGYICAHQTENMDHARGGKGFGPHREAPIGERGGSGAKGMGKDGRATGTTVKSYHKASTGRAGDIENPAKTGATHVHTKEKSRGMPGQKAPPTSKGILGGTVRKAGIDNVRSKGFQAAIGHDTGHPGRMERLSGHARTRAEGRRKSNMY